MGSNAMLAFINPFAPQGKAAGGAALNAVLPKPPQLMLMEQPPKAPGAGEQGDVADKQRKKMAAGESRADTILTGGRGLGEVGSTNLQTKTLLGY